MNANFWNTQNIIILSVGMLAIPTGAAAGLYLLKKSQAAKNTETAPIEFVERGSDPIELDDSPIAVTDPISSHDEHEQEEREIATSEPTSKPIIPEPEIMDPVVEEKVTKTNPIKARPVTQIADPNEVRRLLGRISQATEESELHDHYTELKQALKESLVVERVHNVTFNLKNLHLDHRDETYLVSAMQNSAAMRKYRNHKDAKILVFGYASKDNDPRNTRFALNRAKSAEQAIHEHEEIFGFEGETRSWCIGETDSLSLETDEFCQQHNRAAEIWLVVSGHEVFEEMKSDDFTKTTIKKSKHGHGHHH